MSRSRIGVADDGSECGHDTERADIMADHRCRRHGVGALGVALALVAAACGAAGGDGPEVATVSQLPVVTAASSVLDPSLSEPAATPDPDETPGVVAAEALQVALTETAAVSSYRVESSTAQSIYSPALEIDSRTELDENRPGSIVEVTPEGTHLRVDVRALLGALAAGEPLWFEVWDTGDTAVMDTTAYAALTRADPTVALGPYRPGVFSIDQTRWDELGGGDLVGSVGGPSFDLAMMGAEFRRVLRSVVRIDDGPGIYQGVATWADLTRAQGTDVEVMARSVSAGVALNLAVDAAVLAEIYIEFFENVDADVVVSVSADGLVESIRMSVDLSDLFDTMFSSSRFRSALGASSAEMAQARAAFADTVWTIDSFIRFVPDPDLVIEPAPTAIEDRTEEVFVFLSDSGAFDS
jgi:hypothetical protein